MSDCPRCDRVAEAIAAIGAILLIPLGALLVVLWAVGCKVERWIEKRRTP